MQSKQGSAQTTQPELDRRPKCLRYGEHANAVEKMIVDALPEIVGKLVSMAKEGNVAAARYLVNRILGRPARLAAAPSTDTALPYTDADYEDDLMRHKDWHDASVRAYNNPFKIPMPGEDSISPRAEKMVAVGKYLERHFEKRCRNQDPHRR